MSTQLQSRRGSLSDDTTGASALTSSHSLLPHIAAGSRKSSCASSARVRTSVDVAAVPLDRYRAKLEECASLHRSMAALTRRHEECQQRLAEQDAVNAELRTLLAHLQGVSRRGLCPQCSLGSENEDEVMAVTSRGKTAASPAPTNASPTSSPLLAADVAVVQESGRTRRKLKATAVKSPCNKRTRQLRIPSHGVSSESCTEEQRQRNSSSTGDAAPTVWTEGDASCDASHLGRLQRDSPSSTCSIPRAALHSRASSSSSLASSASASEDTSDSEAGVDVFARPPRYATKPRCSAADAAAYVRAMCEVAASPLGPWEE